MITHSDYCDLPLNEDGECEPCTADPEEKQEYYRTLYAAESHYSREELADAYSHPSDRHKLLSLTKELNQ